MKKALLFFTLILTMQTAMGQLKVTFPSKDGLKITADWYPVSTNMPTILLCHQNKFSRGEYIETALRLNKFGFNCLAIDQRVGDICNNVKNETAAEAIAKKMNPTFADAEQDILAAIDYLYAKNQHQIILWGSSYSASLALKIAAENNKVMAAIVFSPGEYFDDKNFVSSHIKKLIKPIFVTSSKEESAAVTDLLKDVNSRVKIQYIPISAGNHGSKVLWQDAKGNQEYWIALMSFLDKLKKISNQ
jgi:dienelactone hydrolase